MAEDPITAGLDALSAGENIAVGVIASQAATAARNNTAAMIAGAQAEQVQQMTDSYNGAIATMRNPAASAEAKAAALKTLQLLATP
jgi:hypothetical protein